MYRSDRRDFLKTSAVLGAGATLHGFSIKKQSLPGSTSEDLSIFACIHQRRSVRAFRTDPVPDEDIRRILDAARMAPTSGNQQPWKFLVVRNREKLNALKKTAMQRYLEYYQKQGLKSEEMEERKKKLESHYEKIFNAPVFIVVLVDSRSKYPDYNKHDGPLAVANLMLAARALGYGTCYFTDTITEEITMQVLEIPDRYQRICITPVGVPEEWPDTPLKKDLSEFIIYDKFEDS